jgi:hypothetical protein
VRWHVQFQSLAFTRVGALRLVCAVQMQAPDKWNALAVETSGVDPASVLDNHAHELLGEFETEDEAKQAGERYAAEWRRKARSRATMVSEPCDCDTIGTNTPRSTPSRTSEP